MLKKQEKKRNVPWLPSNKTVYTFNMQKYVHLKCCMISSKYIVFVLYFPIAKYI